ncbi:MAG: hypothetical protein RSG77_09815 [Hafnia sp.]
MPFITKEEASIAYDRFVKKGLPREGVEFEKALVRILFREISGAKRLDDYYLDHAEYKAYQKIKH